MIAEKDYYFPISETEHVALIRGVPPRTPVVTTIGHPVRLIWRKGHKMPAAVRLLAKLRGMLDENTGGDGI